jgi:transporter family-2 protein
MLWGIFFSAVAGSLMSIQGVFNTRVSEKIGQWQTNILVQAIGLLSAIAALFIFRGGDFSRLKEVNKLYLLGGVIGAAITFSVIRGMSSLGPTLAVLAILIAQLVTASLFDFFGLCGTERLDFHFTKILGVIIMITGIIIFKLKG